jgi:1-aminocyclopropane-1-carboxylate deaminase/D-cysteine desulfhydrase-like pyridoxal-dependent ACC family enzyme
MAFYGMYELLKKSKQKKKILFWHTGGQAANFSYSGSF